MPCVAAAGHSYTEPASRQHSKDLREACRHVPGQIPTIKSYHFRPFPLSRFRNKKMASILNYQKKIPDQWRWAVAGGLQEELSRKRKRSCPGSLGLAHASPCKRGRGRDSAGYRICFGAPAPCPAGGGRTECGRASLGSRANATVTLNPRSPLTLLRSKKGWPCSAP
jgi:hypothetical protein